MKHLRLLVVILLLTVPVSASYTSATVSAIYPPTAEGGVQVVVTFAGDAGEPSIARSFTLQGGQASALEFRTQVWSALDAVQRANTVSKLLSVGQVIPKPPPSPAVTAEQAWRSDYERWRRVAAAIEAGILTGTEAEVVALKNSVKAGYQAGYLANF